jgi:23S rRNA (guanine745-N1)-methyltransferase
MLQARRAFLEDGHYQPLSAMINELAAEFLASHTSTQSPAPILDAGCGEGYYLAHLQSHLQALARPIEAQCVGLDISKDGVRMAARRYPTTSFLVANLKEPLPLCDAAFQLILNIFAPRNAAEFLRILSPGGGLLVAIPGPAHLKQLRETLSLLDIEDQKQQQVIAQFPLPFELLTTRQISYSMHLVGEQVEQAVMMTPNYWHMGEEKRRALADIIEITTTAEFCCLLFVRHAEH